MNGTIENLGISNINYYVENNGKAPAPVSESESTNIDIGGIVGHTHKAHIYNCTTNGKVEIAENVDSSTSVGGCIGYSNITNTDYCFNNIEIIYSNTDELTEDENTGISIGGIVGAYMGESTYLTNCENIANIDVSADGGMMIGGICGWLSADSDDIYFGGNKNNGSLTITSDDENYKFGMDIGGIIGGIYQLNNVTVLINNSYNIGNIMLTSPNAFAHAGGICGSVISIYSSQDNDDFKLNDCYNTGDIINENLSTGFDGDLGGIIGRIENDTANISCCYNTGKVSYNTTDNNGFSYGSIIGTSDSHESLENCYYNNEDIPVVGNNTEDEIVNCSYLTDFEMQSASSFVGFDFDNVWEIGVTDGYPYPTLRENAVIYPAPVLTVTPGTSTEPTYFDFEYCEDAVRYDLEIYDSNGNFSGTSEYPVEDAYRCTLMTQQSPDTYTACVYAVYEDGTRVASNTATYTVADENNQTPTVEGLQPNYTLALGDKFIEDNSKVTIVTGIVFGVSTFDFCVNIFRKIFHYGDCKQCDFVFRNSEVIRRGIDHEFICTYSVKREFVRCKFAEICKFKCIGRTVQFHTTGFKSGSGFVVLQIHNIQHTVIGCGNCTVEGEGIVSAYLQFDNQHDPSEWLSDEYCSTNPAFMIDMSKIEETGEGYEYNTTFIIHSEGLESNDYARKVRVAVPTANGIVYSDSFTFYVNPIPEHPQTTMGIAYEQTLDISDDTLPPAINAVIKSKEQDKNKNIYYRLSVLTYTVDDDANIFFYWETDGGEFQKVNDDYTEVDFIPDGTNNVTVYMGDGLGYVASYTLTIEE